MKSLGVCDKNVKTCDYISIVHKIQDCLSVYIKLTHIY